MEFWGAGHASFLDPSAGPMGVLSLDKYTEWCFYNTCIFLYVLIC